MSHTVFLSELRGQWTILYCGFATLFYILFLLMFHKYIIYEKEKSILVRALALETNMGLYLGYTLLLTWVNYHLNFQSSYSYIEENNTFVAGLL